MDELLTQTEQSLEHFLVVFLRIGALVSVMPAFGESMLPVRIKLAAALAFALVVAPLASTTSTQGFFENYIVHLVTEPLIGLAFGLGLRMFMLALQTAGSIAANATSLAQVLGGASVDPLPAISHILVIGGIALAVAVGLHVRAVEFMVLTYEIFPPGRFPDRSVLSSWGVAQVSRAFSLAFTLAAPFVIASLIYNLALGAINKAMPQLMVAFVGAPVITFGGLAILALSAPLMLQVWVAALAAFATNPMGPVP